MKDQSKLENKGKLPEQTAPGMTRIKFRPGRAVAGVGGPGDTVTVPDDVADRIVAEGYADRLED